MKKYIITLLSIVAVVFSGCEDVLDRPQKSDPDDNSYWESETALRFFVNGFYENYFVGYNSGWGTAYAPLRGYNFSDDLTSSGTQSNFEVSAPTSRSSTSEIPDMLTQYSGPTWNFAWIRKANLLLERIEKMKTEGKLNNSEYVHWKGVARFFRGYEYSRLVSVFGNVPYFDKTFLETDYAAMYIDRDDRGFVMDKVYEDFQYALANIRENDGVQYLNKYIAAGFVSRFMLFEGTWQKYHGLDEAKAQKYLEFAVSASQVVIDSKKYAFTSDFRSLFGSADLSSNKEVLMYRTYDASLSVTHQIASYSNGNESQTPAPNLSLAKSFICVDGKPYKLSSLGGASKLDIADMVKTRDPRFEATFWDKPIIQSSTLLYACKFIDRVGTTYYGKTVPDIYKSNTNVNDAPIMRYAEVVLNWIEAKAELAESYKGTAITQADLDASINAIRNRPLDEVAIAKGIQKTSSLLISEIPDDPDRDSDINKLLWEIRRERRMEFVFEHTRLLDIKRWKKIQYMSAITHPDNLKGLWINFKQELPSWLVKEKEGVLQVETADGSILTYNGTNGDQMVGYYIPQKVKDRDPFTDRNYMAPVGEQQITLYEEKGYKLTQTGGW